MWSIHKNNFIKKLVLSGSIEIIELAYVFISELPSLEILYISEGMKKIKSAFIQDCKNLKIIHIPTSLESVSPGSFLVPYTKYVTYQRKQYEMLLNGGIPQRALLHIFTFCMKFHSFSLMHISSFLFLAI